MTKVIKVSDDFHSFLKARAEEDKRTIVATLDIVSGEIMSKYLEQAKEASKTNICPEHNVPVDDCKIIVHKRSQVRTD